MSSLTAKLIRSEVIKHNQNLIWPKHAAILNEVKVLPPDNRLKIEELL